MTSAVPSPVPSLWGLFVLDDKTSGAPCCLRRRGVSGRVGTETPPQGAPGPHQPEPESVAPGLAPTTSPLGPCQETLETPSGETLAGATEFLPPRFNFFFFSENWSSDPRVYHVQSTAASLLVCGQAQVPGALGARKRNPFLCPAEFLCLSVEYI